MVVLTALSLRSGRAIVTFLDFYVSHGSTYSEVLKRRRKYYIYFADKSLPFSKVEEVFKIG